MKKIMAVMAVVLMAAQMYGAEATYVASGRSVDYTPTSDIAAGEVVVIGSYVGIATEAISSNDVGAISLAGVFDVVQEALAITNGVEVYWDADGSSVGGTASAGCATTTASGNTFMGFAIATTEATDETVRIVLRSSETTTSGALAVTSIDTTTGTALNLGPATATSVVLGASDAATTVSGNLIAKLDIDSDELDAETATALLLGKATATGVTIGATDAHTTVAGALTVNGASITLEGSKTAGTGYLQLDTNGTGANTNVLLSLGGTFTIGDDGAGTLVETNTAGAAEFAIGILINGARYNILLEKP